MRAPPRRRIDEVVFFLDRCLGTSDVRIALQERGAKVEILSDHFDQDADDPEWISFAAKKGWVILSKDRHLRSNPLEVRSLFQSGAASFILTGAEMTGRQMALAYATARNDMLRFLKKFAKPFVATVTPSGAVALVENYGSLFRKLP